MKTEELLKDRMSDEEMTNAFFTIEHIDPNPIAVGRFAKRNGYKRIRQHINNTLRCYYVKTSR